MQHCFERFVVSVRECEGSHRRKLQQRRREKWKEKESERSSCGLCGQQMIGQQQLHTALGWPITAGLDHCWLTVRSMLNRYRFERVKGVTFFAFLDQWDIKCFTWSYFAIMTVWQSAQQPKVFFFFLSITQMKTLALCTQAVMHCGSSSVPEKFPTPSLQSTRGKTHRVYMHRA